MEQRTREVLEAAMQLQESEREILVELLIPTVEHGDPNEIEAAWREVIARRVKQIEDGTAEFVS